MLVNAAFAANGSFDLCEFRINVPGKDETEDRQAQQHDDLLLQ
jgi:hypothetical protein